MSSVSYTHLDVYKRQLLKGEKLEWVLQKATELNVDTIYLVPTANCVAKYEEKKLQSKVNRWEKIMLEAAQQCGRNHLPTLVVGETLLQALDIESEALKLVAYENEAGQTIKDVLKTLHSDKSVTCLLYTSQRTYSSCSCIWCR